MFKINKTALLLVGAGLVSLPLVCDAKTKTRTKAEKPKTEKVPNRPMATDLQGTWSWGLAVESVKFDSKKAALEGIGDSTTTLDIEAEYFIRNHFTTSFGFSFVPYNDKNDFSVVTQNQTTDEIQTSSSDASAMALYAEMGYRRFFPTSLPYYTTARLGVSSLIASERSISNCSNCPSEDIDINGGIYARAGVGARFGNTWALGLDYKHYLSGDIDSSISLGVTWNSNF
jgi:hypothetical protein